MEDREALSMMSGGEGSADSGRLEGFCSAGRGALFIIMSCAVLGRLITYMGSGGILWPDSLNYLRTAKIIAEAGHIGGGHYYYTPLYPIFLACFLFVGDKPFVGELIVIAQHLMGLISVYLFYRGALFLFSPFSSFLAALILSFSVVLLDYETVIQTEVLFVLVFSVVFYVLARFHSSLDVTSAALLGLLLALLTLTRPVAQLLPVLFVLFILFSRNERKWTSIAALLIIYCAVLTPWLMHNGRVFGTYTVSLGKGINLFMRAYEVDGIPMPEHGRFGKMKQLYDEMKAASPNRKLYFDYRNAVSHKFHKTPARTDRMLYRFALAGIRAHPLQFAGGTFRQMLKFFFLPRNSVHFCDVRGVPNLCTRHVRDLVHPAFPQSEERRWPIFRWLLYGYFSLLSLPASISGLLFVLGVAAMVSKRIEPVRLLLVAIVVYFALLCSIFNVAEDRYRLQVDPVIFMFAACAIEAFFRCVQGKSRRK